MWLPSWWLPLLRLRKAALPGRRCANFEALHMRMQLYTSGSTGKPKGVQHTTGGYMVGAALTTKYVFDAQPDDVYWCTADCGWITGHSYVTYGMLFCTHLSTLTMTSSQNHVSNKPQSFCCLEVRSCLVPTRPLVCGLLAPLYKSILCERRLDDALVQCLCLCSNYWYRHSIVFLQHSPCQGRPVGHTLLVRQTGWQNPTSNPDFGKQYVLQPALQTRGPWAVHHSGDTMCRTDAAWDDPSGV